MIPVLYFRSSSINDARFCMQKYYIRYVLGHTEKKAFKATEKGTIVHKALEIRANLKKALQDGNDCYNDSLIGQVCKDYDLDQQIEIIYNKNLLQTKASNVKPWEPKDLRDCKKLVHKVIDNQMFDPMNQEIIQAEMHFDFLLDRDWSHYEYDLDGEKIKGILGLKGTIDLIVKADDDVYEIIDYKTGDRKDLATDKEKTQESIQKDIQLRLYHLAAKHTFPHIKNFLVTIYYIKDGGPYTITFDDSDLEETENMIKYYFESIKSMNKPTFLYHTRPEQSWKCSKFCYFGKHSFEGTNIEPIIQTYEKSPHCGKNMSMCEQVKYYTIKNGIDWVTKNMQADNHDMTNYKSPGMEE